MDRDVLLALDKAALVDLVLQFLERIAALEAELAQWRQPPKTPATSSVPPSQGQPANRQERRRRKPGARRGHVGQSRRRAAPDAVVRCHPEVCQGCGAALTRTGQRRVGRSQVVELPPVQPVVVEVWRYAAQCQECGERTIGAPPPASSQRRCSAPGSARW